ncbi:hypothetical protein [Planomonospora sp. ID82291]|uniref:hypothetical protein n=1 Tax=Planomonospora sp. ID82291 TaxID=2738136 RepID=UPI0018C3D512|nr:hypothetical protein [Planomonospora sp. ID82291]MBG0818941.1 hypothetical protein [Planomonospora sp. ID82291]
MTQEKTDHIDRNLLMLNHARRIAVALGAASDEPSNVAYELDQLLDGKELTMGELLLAALAEIAEKREQEHT